MDTKTTKSSPPSQNRRPRAVLVTGGPSGLAQQITLGPHQLISDEPAPYGTDQGPDPYDLLLASLGSCTAMTLRLYADRKGWPLKGVSVRLTHEKIHAKDCEGCESETGFIDRIEKQLSLQGDLDEEQRARLLEISDRCPVQKTLKSEIKIHSRLEEILKE